MVCRSVGHQLKKYEFEEFIQIGEKEFYQSLEWVLFYKLTETKTGGFAMKNRVILCCHRCKKFNVMSKNKLTRLRKKFEAKHAQSTGQP